MGIAIEKYIDGDNRGKENLVFTLYMSNPPINNFKDYVILSGDLYRHSNVSDCITTYAYMNTDMYLDLILDKIKYKDQEGDFIFTSGVIGNFKKLSKPERKKNIYLESGILGIHKKEEFKVIKEVI